MSKLVDIAHRVVNEPYGCGDKYLREHSESWAPYLRFLNAVVREYKPAVCLELGVYLGTASAHMATAYKDVCVIGVDRDFHEAARVVPDLYPNVEFIEGDSTEVTTRHKVAEALPWIHLVKDRIGLIFLDSTHDGTTPTNEFTLYRPMFDEECLVVCDDLLGPEHLMRKMMEFWNWLPGEKQELHFLHPNLNSSYDEPGFGVSIVKQGDKCNYA